MKNYIVTGAAGFLGCNLTERLMQEEDAHIYAVVRPNSPHNARLAPSERLTLVPADLSDYARLDEMIGTPCDVFFHLAWQGGRYDFAAQYGNIADTIGALEAAARLGCHRFICTGSQAEYGRQTAVITEETCPHPVCAYGAATLARRGVLVRVSGQRLRRASARGRRHERAAGNSYRTTPSPLALRPVYLPCRPKGRRSRRPPGGPFPYDPGGG